jgi:hypothetical protein
VIGLVVDRWRLLAALAIVAIVVGAMVWAVVSESDDRGRLS